LKVLDLFCCCGGASKGLSVRNEVTGVDITDNHQYPFNFIHSDVFDLKPEFFEQFDFIWASPPCQHFTWARRLNTKHKFPDLIDKTRNLLQNTGKPYIIENVLGAPLRRDLLLCGDMFDLRVRRHRIFESNFPIIQPIHNKHKKRIDKTHSYYVCASGHGGNGYSFKLKDIQNAMGIDWITKKEHLTQAVPPKYSEYIIKYA
jgi:DNA (cytosine-5)-methyltransferase 1